MIESKKVGLIVIYFKQNKKYVLYLCQYLNEFHSIYTGSKNFRFYKNNIIINFHALSFLFV